MASIIINIKCDPLKARARHMVYAVSQYFQDSDALMYLPHYDSVIPAAWFNKWPTWGKLSIDG